MFVQWSCSSTWGSRSSGLVNSMWIFMRASITIDTLSEKGLLMTLVSADSTQTKANNGIRCWMADGSWSPVERATRGDVSFKALHLTSQGEVCGVPACLPAVHFLVAFAELLLFSYLISHMQLIVARLQYMQPRPTTKPPHDCSTPRRARPRNALSARAQTFDHGDDILRRAYRYHFAEHTICDRTSAQPG